MMLNLLSENFVIYYDHIRLEDIVLTIICRENLIHTRKKNKKFSISKQTKRIQKIGTFAKCVSKNKKPICFVLRVLLFPPYPFPAHLFFLPKMPLRFLDFKIRIGVFLCNRVEKK